MLDNIKLGVKLVGGFVLVAAISVIVAVTGAIGFNASMKGLDFLKDDRLPDSGCPFPNRVPGW